MLLVLGPVIGAWVASRTRLAQALAAASTLPLLALTLVPVDRVVDQRCVVGYWSLAGFGQPEPAANVLLLALPVLLLGLAIRRPLTSMIAGCAAAALIELAQGLLPSIGRSCTVSDWLWNAIGALLGAAIAAVSLRLGARSDT